MEKLRIILNNIYQWNKIQCIITQYITALNNKTDRKVTQNNKRKYLKNIYQYETTYHITTTHKEQDIL